MDETSLTEIVWAETSALKAADRSDLLKVRQTVAALLTLGHEDLFAPRLSLTAPAEQSDDISQCQEAVRDALAGRVHAVERAALWPSRGTAPAQTPRGPDWLYVDSQSPPLTGTIVDCRFPDETLRLYQATPGLSEVEGPRWRSWPHEAQTRSDGVGQDEHAPRQPAPPFASRPQTPPDVFDPEPIRPGPVRVGKALAACSFILFALAAIWSFWLGDVSRRTFTYFETADAAAYPAPPKSLSGSPNTPPAAPPALVGSLEAARTFGQECIGAIEASSRTGDAIRPESWQLKAGEIRALPRYRTDCTSRWALMLDDAAAARPTLFQPISQPGLMEDLGRWLASLATGGGRLSLSWPVGLTMIAIGSFVIATGFILKGRWSGWLIDGDNRMSLARTQLAAWSVVLLGGLTSLGLFNIGLQSELMRRATQIATESAERVKALEVPGGADAGTTFISTVVSSIGFFPTMDWRLWALLGLIGGTAALSPLLNTQKREIHRIARKPSAKAASLEDLFVSDDPTSSQTVDLSRVQQIVATGTLLAGYAHLVFAYSRGIDGLDVVRALTTGASVFPTMPPVDVTFLGLLGVSTGAYLGTKYWTASRPVTS